MVIYSLRVYLRESLPLPSCPVAVEVGEVLLCFTEIIPFGFFCLYSPSRVLFLKKKSLLWSKLLESIYKRNMKEITVAGVEDRISKLSRWNHSYLDFSDLCVWLHYINVPFAILKNLSDVSLPIKSQGKVVPSSLKLYIHSPMSHFL